MPWFADVAAVVTPWLGGQELGEALAMVLAGDAEPGGRSPCTWPAEEADVPVWQVAPVAGRLIYREGIHVGYREWSRRRRLGGPAPVVPFGFGLGYTTWHVVEASLKDADADGLRVAVRARNTGSRRGKFVAQLYAEPTGGGALPWPTALPSCGAHDERPVRWLVGFATTSGEPGADVELDVVASWRALRHWCVACHRWEFDGRGMELSLAQHADDAGVPITGAWATRGTHVHATG